MRKSTEILRPRLEAFARATTLPDRQAGFIRLMRAVWGVGKDREFQARLGRLVQILGQEPGLLVPFVSNVQATFLELDSISLFAQAGLPARHDLGSEGVRRVIQRLLPVARHERDAARLLSALFPEARDVDRFLKLSPEQFEAFLRMLGWPSTTATGSKINFDAQQALRLLAIRIAGRAANPAMWRRSDRVVPDQSPFYQLVFLTERMVSAETPEERLQYAATWESADQACRATLVQVHQHMEESGVSSDLVFDIGTIEASLTRMEALIGVLAAVTDQQRATAARALFDQLVAGQIEDRRLSSLLRQNLNLLARKTVERTGRSGEHYIAHSKTEYGQMWLAALGGGLITVFTAAIKMSVIDGHYPLFVEGFLAGTNYAVSFVVLQTFGLVLATKQPSMTAATLAGIVRDNRGSARSARIADFVARISRTQLAAALGNIIAVAAGAIGFERLWRYMFSQPYLAPESARHVYETLHPWASGTGIDAALTGVILWLAALIGGWCENFAVFNHLPQVIEQHPIGNHIGAERLARVRDIVERNLAGWATSISLGYMLGFVPVLAQFFGLPLDVRHVTLSTGTLALAAARFGTESFRHNWFYFAVSGIAITFVLNLGVSFSIAAFVALRAYDVPRREQIRLLIYVLKDFFRKPLRFLVPVEKEEATPVASSGKH